LYNGVYLMRTTVTSKGQTVVPAPLRRRYRIGAGTALEWIETGKDIRVVPIPADPVAALRGSAKGQRLAEKLHRSRQLERQRER